MKFTMIILFLNSFEDEGALRFAPAQKFSGLPSSSYMQPEVMMKLLESEPQVSVQKGKRKRYDKDT